MFGVVTTYKLKQPLTEDQIAEIRDKAIKSPDARTGLPSLLLDLRRVRRAWILPRVGQ